MKPHGRRAAQRQLNELQAKFSCLSAASAQQQASVQAVPHINGRSETAAAADGRGAATATAAASDRATDDDAISSLSPAAAGSSSSPVAAGASRGPAAARPPARRGAKLAAALTGAPLSRRPPAAAKPSAPPLSPVSHAVTPGAQGARGLTASAASPLLPGPQPAQLRPRAADGEDAAADAWGWESPASAEQSPRAAPHALQAQPISPATPPPATPGDHQVGFVASDSFVLCCQHCCNSCDAQPVPSSIHAISSYRFVHVGMCCRCWHTAGCS